MYRLYFTACVHDGGKAREIASKWRGTFGNHNGKLRITRLFAISKPKVGRAAKASFVLTNEASAEVENVRGRS